MARIRLPWNMRANTNITEINKSQRDELEMKAAQRRLSEIDHVTKLRKRARPVELAFVIQTTTHFLAPLAYRDALPTQARHTPFPERRHVDDHEHARIFRGMPTSGDGQCYQYVSRPHLICASSRITHIFTHYLPQFKVKKRINRLDALLCPPNCPKQNCVSRLHHHGTSECMPSRLLPSRQEN